MPALNLPTLAAPPDLRASHPGNGSSGAFRARLPRAPSLLCATLPQAGLIPASLLCLLSRSSLRSPPGTHPDDDDALHYRLCRARRGRCPRLGRPDLRQSPVPRHRCAVTTSPQAPTDTLTRFRVTSHSHRPVQAVPVRRVDLLQRDRRPLLVGRPRVVASSNQLDPRLTRETVTSQRGSFLTANKDCVTGNKCPPKTFADGASVSCSLSRAARSVPDHGRASQAAPASHATKSTPRPAQTAPRRVPPPGEPLRPHLRLNAHHFRRVRSDSGSCLSAGKCLFANRIRPGFYCPGAAQLLPLA